VNLSRGEIAYNIIDVENEPTQDIIAAIAKADGVIRVRLIPPVPH
jgi:D-3-phosphoglycerate dehydrogenase